ncbi:CGNR zinc finger domain-containing protein [Streptomyces olivaceoviridis]
MAKDTVSTTPSDGVTSIATTAEPVKVTAPRKQLLTSPDATVDAVLAFANTHADGGSRVERFTDADGLSAWLIENGLTEAAADVSAADVGAVRELRDAVVTVLLGHSADPGTSDTALGEAENHLRRAAVRYPVTAVVDRHGARLVPAQRGLPGALAGILAAIAELALTGTWNRLKACRNQPCHFAFYDRSRNTSAAYCSTGCSAQVAMRNYRKRRRTAASPASGTPAE